MAKYGINRDFDSKKKSGIFRYFLFFLLAVFLLLVLLNVFDKTGGFKTLFSSKPNEAEVTNISIKEAEPGVINSFEPETKTTLVVDKTKNSIKAEQGEIEIENENDTTVPESEVSDSDLPENDSSNIKEDETEEDETEEDETGIKVHGRMDDNKSIEGFKVDGVMAIHQQVPDSMLIKPLVMRHVLPNGEALEFMSDSSAAKLLNVLEAGNVTTEPLVLEQVYFYYDSDRLKRQSFATIEKIAKIVTIYPKAKILIRGHTDNKGSKQYNKKLSLKRAKIAMKSLVASGVNPKNMKVLGIGPSEPLVPNDNPDNRQINRRIDISIVK